MIRDFFAPDGPLGKQFGRWEARPEQVSMAEAVFNAAKDGTSLVVEAGTGVGKSLGYLAPILDIIKDNRIVRETVFDPNTDEEREVERPRRLVVATGTITLQRQLMDKDLPMLKTIFPWLTYAMAVGSENYLCGARLKKALDEVKDNPLLFGEVGDLEALDSWSKTTATGLRMDLPKPVANSAWTLVNRQSDLCRCKTFEREAPCFYRKAKAEQKLAHCIIVNHHLLMTALTIEQGEVIPRWDYLVIDELHGLEEVATQCFGTEISNYRIDRLAKDAARVLRGAKGVTRAGEIKERLDNVSHSADKLFAIMKQHLEANRKDAVRLLRPLVSTSDLSQVEMIEQLNLAAALLKEAGDQIEDAQKSHEVKAVAKRAEGVAKEARTWLLQSEADHVYQIVSENGGKRIVAKSNPIDISEEMSDCIWKQKFVTIGTSATISTSGTMEFVKGKLGAQGAAELVLSSPFDYVKNAMIYVASDLPEAKPGLDPAYYSAMVNRVTDLLKISRGRAMVLCTSNQSMKTLGARLRGLLPELKIMIQGEDLERHQMIEELKRNPRAVICGVASMWTGVDVPGDALQMVIITKLPFPNVGDPLFEARCERIDAVRPGTFRAFNKLSVPEMVIKLKQGFGRLIRSSTDWGCVAILDTRVITKRYGGTILASLPRTPIKYTVNEVGDFFRHRQPADAVPETPVEDPLDEVPF